MSAEEKKGIPELVAELEVLLHEELPSAARALTDAQDGATSEERTGTLGEVMSVVGKLDVLQRQIGMATFEMIRKGPAASQQFGEEISAALNAGREPAGPRPDTAPPISPPAPRCGACARFATSGCPTCNQRFCGNHADPAFHPCGEQP